MASKYSLRQHPRFRTEVDIMVRPVGKFSWIRATMVNLSRGGLLLQSPEVLTTGSRVEVEFNTTAKDGKVNRRRMRAEVLWRRGGRYGLRFGS